MAVREASDDEDGDEPPPPVPDFEVPPPVPVFETEVEEPKSPVESDSMLDSIFNQIATPVMAKKAAPSPMPSSPAVAFQAKKDSSFSDSFLDSVFAEIQPAPGSAAKKGSVAGLKGASASNSTNNSSFGDVTDSFLDSVYQNISVSPRRVAVAHQLPSPSSPSEDMRPSLALARRESIDPDENEGDDLLGSVFSQIHGGGGGGGGTSVAAGSLSASQLIDEVDAEDVRRTAKSPGPSMRRRGSGVGLGLGPSRSPSSLSSPGLSRTRVKSFAPATIGPVDASTIRAASNTNSTRSSGNTRVESPGTPSASSASNSSGSLPNLSIQRQVSRAKLESVMVQLKRPTTVSQIESRVLYNLGTANPPSCLRFWGSKALLVVAGDQIYIRTLKTEEKLGHIVEPGVKVAFQEPGTDRLWIAGKDPVLKVFDLNKPDEAQYTITSHSEWVATVELYAPGVVATASADKTVRIWKLPSLKSVVCKGHLDYVTCLTMVTNPVDENLPPILASGSCDKTIRFWDYNNPQAQKTFVATELRTLFGHTGWVWSICSDAKHSLWSSGRDCSLRNWNTKTGELIKELKLESSVTKLVMHDKTMFAVDEALVITMLRKGKVFKKLSGHTGKIRCMAFLGDCAFSSGDDRIIRRWNMNNGSCVGVLKGHTDSVLDLRSAPEFGRLYSASDDGTVREWVLESGSSTDAIVIDNAVRQDVELLRLRSLMKDPLYRSAAICQAIIRMRFVRDSIRHNRVLLFGAKSRYRGLCSLVSFEQNHLACISQFLSGFLVPIQTFMKRHPDGNDFARIDQVSGFADALYAAYVFHSNLLERLEHEKDTYPFCIDTGAILEADQSAGQLYLLLLDFIPILVEWSSSGMDGLRSAFFEKVEADQSLRLDHGACRLLMWGFTRYWMQVRLPTVQILRFTPSSSESDDSRLLCAALARMSVLESIIRLSTEGATARSRFSHMMFRYVPSDVANVEKKWFQEAGPLVVEETAVLKQARSVKSPSVRLIVLTNAFLVLTDTGNAKKDRVVETIAMNSVLDAMIQAGTENKEVIVRTTSTDLSAIASDSKQQQQQQQQRKGSSSLSSSSSSVQAMARTLTFGFVDGKKAAVFVREFEQAKSRARFGISRKKLEVQVEEFKRQRPAAPPMPEFPSVLIQYLRKTSDDTLATVLNFPSSELKVESIAEAFDCCSDPTARSAAVCAVLPSAGIQNVFSALIESFLRLPSPIVEADARKALLMASNAVELRKIFGQPALKMQRDVLSYLFWFLGERLVPALNRSEFEDPLEVVSSIVCMVVFWEPREARRMIMDIPRAMAATKIMVNSYMDVFPKIDMPNLVVVDESKVQVELAKKLAKEKYEAEEQERARAMHEREKQEVETLKNNVVEAEDSKRVKAELEQMVQSQRAEFEKKQAAQEQEKVQNESAFEALKRQQAEAKVRAEAKLKSAKERMMGSAGVIHRTHSDASLSSVLSDLDLSASSSPIARHLSPVKSASSAHLGYSSANSSFSKIDSLPRPIPKIVIPEIQLTPGQQRMIIVIPKLV